MVDPQLNCISPFSGKIVVTLSWGFWLGGNMKLHFSDNEAGSTVRVNGEMFSNMLQGQL